VGSGNLRWVKLLQANPPHCSRHPLAYATGLVLALLLGNVPVEGRAAPPKQKSLDEWRALTSPSAPAPRVFVKGNTIRFYFQTETGVMGFSANWSHHRIPTDAYKVRTALIQLEPGLPPLPEGRRGWREARVIAGSEWHQLTTNLIAALTPQARGHGVYYQGLLADRLLYRDAEGLPKFGPVADHPDGLIIDRRFSIEETLELLARLMEENLLRTHPQDSLFLLLAPNARRFPLPMLLDRKQRQCVWLSPAALYDNTERGFGVATTIQGIAALLFEGHGLALVKNPISSVVRLGDLGVQTAVRFLRFPFPKPGNEPPAPTRSHGMDLVEWEKWLDKYTGTRCQEAALDLLIDGEQFFPRLQQAFAAATNHINLDVYIFDKDDVAVGIADQLKARSSQVAVKVILDQMGSLAAGTSPPATPLPEDFIAPASINGYLKKDSKVQVRPFLNPWLSADHSKVYLVDGVHAWLGGMNVGREYRYEWHDLMVELEGPIVATLEDEFRRDWAHASLLGDLAYFGALVTTPKRSEATPSAGLWSQARLLPTKTAWKPFSTAVQGVLRKAQQYIYLENPYLFDKRVIVGLARARNRGVDVRVVLPRINDFKAAGRGNLVIANYLLQHGVRVYFYPGMTHVKALMADDWACLGSGNLNHLSLRVCQEQNIATSEPGFNRRLKQELFDEDFAHSYELTEPVSVDWVDFLADLVLEGF
jgi:phosphatidylserine/phosphatidylglycerophosphate/cardiolipin synthase-like enzyme